MQTRFETIFLGAALFFAGCPLAGAQASCPPPDWPIAELRALKSDNWKIADPDGRQTLALALLPCLRDTDPELRDGIAFEALSSLLRGKLLTPESQTLIYQSQIAALDPSLPDAQGFGKPFAALTLSEVARADRLVPFLSNAQRAALVEVGTRYLQGVTDYRGFATGQGWRHGVAHGADLMLQLALNPAVDKTQLERIVRAVQRQVAPAGEHFYIYGEPDRLVRPIIYAANRGLLAPVFWSDWLQTLASPAPLANWELAFQSQAGLARMHNTKAFLRALDAALRQHEDAALNATFATPLAAALKQLP